MERDTAAHKIAASLSSSEREALRRIVEVTGEFDEFEHDAPHVIELAQRGCCTIDKSGGGEVRKATDLGFAVWIIAKRNTASAAREAKP
jgi:hypothetical protein